MTRDDRRILDWKKSTFHAYARGVVADVGASMRGRADFIPETNKRMARMLVQKARLYGLVQN